MNISSGKFSAPFTLTDGVMPPTLNHDQTDPACPVLVARESRKVTKPCVLKVACTESGQCAAAVVRRGG